MLQTGFDTSQDIPFKFFFKSCVFAVLQRFEWQKVIAGKSICSLTHSWQKVNDARAETAILDAPPNDPVEPSSWSVYVQTAGDGKTSETTKNGAWINNV
ncbi:hypothetical protein E1180_15715 [Roseibium denhamense]|uniref:hypothetical protein n=1 Tax=Roseibium denhamense TaxID=76305 RepID=UPI0012BC65E1|nr:hypothetical protein [Roseibium denhamense]MTI06960.1 hypothetical protein [Roseibium denhamense]